MQLIKSEDIITDLMQFEDLSSFKKLQCWIKQEEHYNIHIFTIQLNSEDELLRVKDGLRDCLAIYFQSQTLEKAVERWNIYQVFFVEGIVSKDVKLNIEQDKFATRKLLLRDNIGKALLDEDIVKELDSRIFQFELKQNEQTRESLNDVLVHDDIELLSTIEKVDGNIDELLKQLENE